MKYLTLICFLFLLSGSLAAQHVLEEDKYNYYDSLRGSITDERAWWDLQHYELSVSVEPSKQSIKGTNIIRYKVLETSKEMQIDLQYPLQINQILQDGKKVNFKKDSFAYFVYLNDFQKVGEINELTIEYSGKPRVAKRAPWDGGFSWALDEHENHFIATSNQGIGASIWWPCKDHMYDEPDEGMLIHANVPANLVAVANGRLIKTTTHEDKTKTYSWRVVNPINNYGVNINIGDYVHFSEKYKGEKGELDMDYWVLSYNLEKAKIHFKDALRTMEALEHWFGPYPFYEDSYKLVEVPYLGMEHQSSVTYGNGYQNGYLGNDLSSTGWGLKFDFIIVHETGHEWFANNITYKDVADMWIHESFTNYSESLFLEYFYGKEAAAEYVRGLRIGIYNITPIIGDYEVNKRGSGDMYNKGGNMLHTLRQVVNDDDKWRAMLRGLNEEFYHQTVSSKQVEDYMSKTLEMDLKPFFDQYLRDSRIPVFEYRIQDGMLLYRWTNCVNNFNMPINIIVNGEEKELKCFAHFPNRMQLTNKNPLIEIDPDYYVYHFNAMGTMKK